MKVLIIALARTGSTNLLYKLSNENNLKLIFEPYNPKGYIGPSFDLDEDNIIIKTIFWQPSDRTNDIIQWYIDLSKKFNNIILLSRKNLRECAESWAYFKYNNVRNGFESNQEYVWELTPNFDEQYKFIIEQNQKLIELSNKLKIPITYYEDLYANSTSGKLRLGDRDKLKNKFI
jgi:hypothetical protein